MLCVICKTKQILKKQLFRNNTVHIRSYCKCIGRYVEKTRKNLELTIGWVEENEQTKEMDTLLGLIKELKCGNCDDCSNCICPCHWP